MEKPTLRLEELVVASFATTGGAEPEPSALIQMITPDSAPYNSCNGTCGRDCSEVCAA